MAEATIHDIMHPGWRDEEISRLRESRDEWKELCSDFTKAMLWMRDQDPQLVDAALKRFKLEV